MDSRDLLNKMVEKELKFRKEDFLAPYTEQSTTAVVKMAGANYKFRIVGCRDSGFGVFRPIDPNCARFLKSAAIEDVRMYLDLLPKIHFILSFENEEGWVGYPMNLEATTRSIGLQSEVIVRNVNDCERFDAVVARYDGLHFWYDEPFPSADFQKSEQMRECFDCDGSTTPVEMRRKLSYIKSLSPEQSKSFELAIQSWLLFKKLTTEERLREEFAVGGGKVKSFVVRGRNLDVKWASSSGAEYRSIVDKENLGAVSAGFCLSGGDRKFHAKDLPFLANMAESQGGIVITNRHLRMDDDGEVTETSMRYGYDFD